MTYKPYINLFIAFSLLSASSITFAKAEPPANVAICPDYNDKNPSNMTILPCSLYIGRQGGGVHMTYFKDTQSYFVLKFKSTYYNRVPMKLSYYDKCGIPNHKPHKIEKTIAVNLDDGEQVVIETNCTYDYLEKSSPGLEKLYGIIGIEFAAPVLGAIVEINQ